MLLAWCRGSFTNKALIKSFLCGMTLIKGRSLCVLDNVEINYLFCLLLMLLHGPEVALLIKGFLFLWSDLDQRFIRIWIRIQALE
ncbi:hypothetical protein RchiOBHm_Chr1g0331351 [Rosa chinensis]|uniref:Uncharacterized protein n=1 Tax=Rosa chinensis TaxID=74649 RepID=A0A2P6SBH9_ROSCH|nr:hypothetical protein RchiOBHm_Chr1g0331351 [Rosa chinensis]